MIKRQRVYESASSAASSSSSSSDEESSSIRLDFSESPSSSSSSSSNEEEDDSLGILTSGEDEQEDDVGSSSSSSSEESSNSVRRRCWLATTSSESVNEVASMPKKHVMEPNASCTICFEELSLLEEVPLLACLHEFHTECWTRYHTDKLKQRQVVTCPICRRFAYESSSQII